MVAMPLPTGLSILPKHFVQGGPPSDAGSQYTSISLAETLALEGIVASIGRDGDAYDNASAESTIGLFKTEAVSKGSPFLAGPLKTIDDIEFATMGGSTGSTRAACTAPLVTSRPMNSRDLLRSTIGPPTGVVASIGAATNPDGSHRPDRRGRTSLGRIRQPATRLQGNPARANAAGMIGRLAAYDIRVGPADPRRVRW